MQLRNAKKEELPIIRDMRVKAYSDHKDSIPLDHWEALKNAITSEGDVHPDVDLIIAEINGEIVGSVAVFPPNSDAYEGYVDELEYPEIRMLSVSGNARGKGVATALVEECIRRSSAKGYKAIGLHTADFMKSAMHLYERMGFERIPKYDFEPANDGIVVKAFRRFI
ncbi:GNAT family N-acetyltransferase [Evansella sp. AB-rgal1]|uniref:GNAT family N-acetyltransferase n=1 Tax=Evansella sp. AB-rgal1 TaxID=3242696 RepID=UPI00359CF7DE